MDSSFIDLKNFNGTPFELFQNLNVENERKFTGLTGNLKSSSLSDLYFSQSNIDYLQDQIIERVFKKSFGKYKVGKQSEEELTIIMRSIYLQFGKNNDSQLQLQIDELNEKVLEYCIPNIITNAEQYLGYVKKITSKREVMEKPKYVHVKGDKTLMPKHFF